jgi:hypothetical protein
MVSSQKSTHRNQVYFKKVSAFDPETSQMTAKAVSQFDHGLLNDEPHKGQFTCPSQAKIDKKGLSETSVAWTCLLGFHINEPAPNLCHGPKSNLQSDLFERLRYNSGAIVTVILIEGPRSEYEHTKHKLC